MPRPGVEAQSPERCHVLTADSLLVGRIYAVQAVNNNRPPRPGGG